MKNKTILLQFIFALLMITSYGQINKDQSYDELEALAVSHFRSNNTDSAIIVMEFAFENYPEEIGRTTSLLAGICTRVGRYSRAIEIWEIGIGKGYIYSLNDSVYQKYYKGNTDFERIAKLEKNRLDTTHLKHEIILPIGFVDTKNYPIVFIFHGNGRNIEKSKVSWKSKVMDNDFIAVFVQSCIPSSLTDYSWYPNDAKIKKEFSEVYDQVISSYSVENTKIIFAGMSAGGYKALEFSLNDYFSATGLVLNCPVIPPNYTDGMISNFVENNRKLGIITGEKDFALENQKKLIGAIDENGGKTKMLVNEGLSHEFSHNFTELLDEYLKWVIE